MADSLDQLYQHIVQAFALKDDLIDIDLNANANESGGDLNAAKQEAIEREQAVSSQLEPYFRSGLAKALAAGNTEIALSDQDPIENKEADALIRYLVSYELASSRSEETPPGYTYFIQVNWDKLRQVATGANIDFDAALSGVR
ncbi:MAG: hypothetical protein KC438_02085 [Thermomicrobiales bacterium]|nr:hypothetical protein [Thermomicrobiales bacterium]MCO5221481.1 hypothetical protein [Thermomicrobiales bacterium]